MDMAVSIIAASPASISIGKTCIADALPMTIVLAETPALRCRTAAAPESVKSLTAFLKDSIWKAEIVSGTIARWLPVVMLLGGKEKISFLSQQ